MFRGCDDLKVKLLCPDDICVVVRSSSRSRLSDHAAVAAAAVDVIITCFIRCWQNAAKYDHEVGLIYIKSR